MDVTAVLFLGELPNSERRQSKMRHKTYNKSALETRVDYVETKLDSTIKDFKEAMQQMENRHQVNFSKLEASLDKVVAKAESSRRWSIGTVVTIAITVIGSLVTFIIFLLTNGFQFPS